MAVALPEGTEIGGFQLADVIGRGGFGITYRARDRRTEQVYAIKEYLPEDYALRDPDGTVSARPGQGDTYARGLSAFLVEAEILKHLPRREGLVRVRGAFERSGTAYCVMEFIEGDSLDRLSRRMKTRLGHIPAELVADLAAAVCWALDALHEKGVIHRDVKPANIMIRRDGRPVLIDFGAARQVSHRGEQDAIFTRRYAAIEQFPPDMSGFGRSFEEGPWSDIYSLSVVLYDLIALDTPPSAIDRAACVLASQPDPYVPLAEALAGSGRQDEYEPGLLEAIDAGCDLLPRGRPQSVRAFANRFRSLPPPPKREDAGGAISGHKTQIRSAATGRRQGNSRAGIAIILLVLAATGAALLYREFMMPEVF